MDRKNKNLEEPTILAKFNSSKLVQWLKFVDKEITINLKSSHFEMRPGCGNGLWGCLLIPTILIIYCLQCEVSVVYQLTACLSVGVLAYSLIFMLFLYLSCLILKDRHTSGCVASGFLAAVPIYWFTYFSFTFCAVFITMTIVSYCYLLRHVIVSFPRTFSIGEAMIVSQGIVLFYVASIVTVYLGAYMPRVYVVDENMAFVQTYVITALSTVGLIVTALLLLNKEQKTVYNFAKIFSSGFVFVTVILTKKFGIFCYPKFFAYLFLNKVRAFLFGVWLSLVLVAVLVLSIRTKSGERATTATRKSFHVMASIVFTSGILTDVHFMALAAGIAFAAIILIEAVRVSNIKPMSSVLQSAFEIYKDEKDRGLFAMTPIYLYVGLACPLLLVPWRQGADLELLSGVLSVGIGDSAASWGGRRYGRRKWTESSPKTMEGTACNIATQILVVHFLNCFEILDVRAPLLRTVIAAVASGLAEAHIDQVDNLVLPFISLLAFQFSNWIYFQ